MIVSAVAPTLPQLIFGHWEIVAHWRDCLAPTAAVLLYAGLYVWGVVRVNREHRQGRRGSRPAWPWGRTFAFMGGIFVLLAALESGIDAYDDRLLSVHMVQHMLLLDVAPVLVLAGQPVRLLLAALPRHRRQYVGRALMRGGRRITHPLVCLAVFWLTILGTHLPAFYDLTLRDPTVHDCEHALYFFVGLLLWWPLLDAEPSPAHRLNGIQRLAYVIAAMPPMAIVGAYLDRSATLVYAPYRAAALALGVNPLADQAKAGAIMWVGGGTFMAVAGLVVAWRGLAQEERLQRRRDQYAEAGERPLEVLP